MPRIRPYESQVGSQGDLPSRSAGVQDFGGAGLSNLGQGVENLGQSAGQAQRIIQEAKSRQEVTDEHIAHIDSVSRLTQQIDEKAKAYVAIDPETGKRNPTMSEIVPGLVKAELDQRGLTEDGGSFYETQSGQNAFRTNSAQLSQHFVGVAQQIDGKLAGEAAVNAVRGATDKLGAHVYAHPVPANVGLAMGKAEQLIKDPYGAFANLPAQHQDKVLRDMQEVIATRSVEGSIRQFPNRTLMILQQPPEARDEQYNYIAQYVPNEKINELINSAEKEVRGLDISKNQEAEEERRRIRELSESTNSSLEQQRALHMIDPKQPKVTPRDILDAGLNRGLSSEKQGMWLNMIDEQARRGPAVVHSNPVVKRRLFENINRAVGDSKKLTSTDDINKEYMKGQLNDTDMDWLVKKFTDRKSPDGDTLARDKSRFYKNVEQTITKPGPFGIYADPSTGLQLDRFITDTEALVEEYIKKGKKDPRDLFTFGKPDYRGHPSVLQSYQQAGFGSIQQDAPVMQPEDFGLREDGTKKGMGYFGKIQRSDSKDFSTELSATGDLKDKNGKPVLYPLLVPGLTKQEVDTLVSGGKPTESIHKKAEAHASKRMNEGKSPFAGPGEQVAAPRKSLDDIFGKKP